MSQRKRFTAPKYSAIRRSCPHCEAPARIRTSEAQSALSRITKYQCSNIDCCHVWVEGSEVLYSIVPSASPNPTVKIPVRYKERN
ncbi:ogr/Delta-like zinc finger family protein [Oceanisphaera arctica]|uniref:ogr/Delta-like zinc finger family protein n=1 Tax=Oceanisphaera arctica TaxID=641510 RepID=UPI001E316E12|nr:ogr/Delta-like zinc finger family protein [Oceanisphaera arctica]